MYHSGCYTQTYTIQEWGMCKPIGFSGLGFGQAIVTGCCGYFLRDIPRPRQECGLNPLLFLRTCFGYGYLMYTVPSLLHDSSILWPHTIWLTFVNFLKKLFHTHFLQLVTSFPPHRFSMGGEFQGKSSHAKPRSSPSLLLESRLMT